MRYCLKPATLTLATALALAAALSAGGSEPLFHVAILGDRTGGHVPGVYPAVIDEVNLLGPDIVVTVGDHIEGYEDDLDVARAEWDSLNPLLGRLNAPVYMTPGNHDIWSDAAEPVYVEKTGQKPYYSFDYEGVHFVILDTGRIETAAALAGAQLEWLLADLEEHKDAARTFVFFHKPFWEQALPQGKPDPLHDVFVKYGVDAVFNGHYHVTIMERFDGIDYVVIGSSGVGIEHASQSVPRGEFYQFGWVTVRPDGHEIAVVDQGNVHPFGVVTEATLAEVARVESENVTVTPVRVVEDTSARAEVTVTVRNGSSRSIDDTLVWDVPDGWVLDPPQADIEVAPGASWESTFTALNPGALYPTPILSFGYPLASERDLVVEVPLRAVRTVTAPAATSAPTIDGHLSEPCWSTAAPVARLFAQYEETVEGGTRFLFTHDDANLYVAAVCEEPMMDLLAASVADRDGAVYGEDCVGFFIQPDRDSMVVYQVYWNALGTVFDQRISFDESLNYATDRDWNGEYEAAAARGAGAWTVEIRIPFASFGAEVGAGTAWGLNFRRKQARTGASADWQVPIDYNPRSFGELVFE